jgi:hypothetical protein
MPLRAECLDAVTAQGFRGAPQRWTINPAGQSLVVLGENGTGKSTIADALEFFYTGRLEGLSHEGRGSALVHLSRSTPTLVEIRTTAGKTSARHLPPQSLDSPAVGEMFLLRGRSIVEFIEKPKAQNWRVLAELVGLDRIDGLRLIVQKVRNDLRDEAAAARAAASSAKRALNSVARGSEDDETVRTLVRASVPPTVDPQARALVDLGVLLERGRAHREASDRQRQLDREAALARELLERIQAEEHALQGDPGQDLGLGGSPVRGAPPR